MKGDKNDFVWGHIFSVTETFMKSFIKEGKKISPSTDKYTKTLAQLYGCWY